MHYIYNNPQGLVGDKMYGFDIDQDKINFIKNALINFYYCNQKGKITSKGYNFSSGYDTALLRDHLSYLYLEEGLGFKMIVKILEIEKCSYSSLRTLFSKLGIKTRKGNKIITNKLKQMRRENVIGEKNPWRDWPNKKPQMHAKSSKYLGGYYYNRSKQKDVYLRSSWEFAYANWLDNNDFEWDVEVHAYLLSDGRYYRPDFFLYENGKLTEIIEIKGKFLDRERVRIDKFDMCAKEYPHVKIRILFKEDIFDALSINYNKNILEWKKIRRSKNESINNL